MPAYHARPFQSPTNDLHEAIEINARGLAAMRRSFPVIIVVATIELADHHPCRY